MEKLTILHLSDLQFGRHHRFASHDVEGTTGPTDRFFDTLKADLDHLAIEEAVRFDLVIVTGDLAEQGLPSEFKQAEQFLRALMEYCGQHLAQKLSEGEQILRRLCLIPGNHD